MATKIPKYYVIVCLFIFHFVLPIFPWKWKTSYWKSHNLSDEKSKTKLPKYVMSLAKVAYLFFVCFLIFFRLKIVFWNMRCIFFSGKIDKMSGEENDKVNVQAYGILMMAMTALGAIINISSIIILSRRDTPTMFHTSLKVRAFK